MAIAEQEASVPMALVVACVVVGLVVLMGLIVAVVGLLIFKPWARALALATTVASVAFWPLLGTTVQSGWNSALLQVSAVAWGAVLASAYWSPIAPRFRRQGAN